MGCHYVLIWWGLVVAGSVVVHQFWPLTHHFMRGRFWLYLLHACDLYVVICTFFGIHNLCRCSSSSQRCWRGTMGECLWALQQRTHCGRPSHPLAAPPAPPPELGANPRGQPRSACKLPSTALRCAPIQSEVRARVVPVFAKCSLFWGANANLCVYWEKTYYMRQYSMCTRHVKARRRDQMAPPLAEESLSPIGSPAPLDRPGSHDASRGNSPGKAPPAGRVAVPRLSLPLPATQRPASAGMHRSTRRTSTNSHRNSPSLVSRLSSLGRSPSQREHSAPGGPSAELAALAQSLAQSLVAQDLTALIRAKRVTQGSRSSSPMARDAGGQGAFSARSTPAATPRPVGALDADIEPAMPVETAPPVPATGVTDPDLRRRCCVLESLRRLLGGHAPLDAATRQDTLLWLIHETLVASGDGEAAVHRALCLQLLQVLGGGHGGMRGRLDDTAKALEPQPSSRWLAAERCVCVYGGVFLGRCLVHCLLETTMSLL